MAANKLFNEITKRGSEFLNVKYPIICGAMTWVSEPNLVSAVCNAGCFGCLAGGNMPTEVLEQQLAELRSKTNGSFAINLITVAPNYKLHLDLLKDLDVEYVVFAGSFPKEKEVAMAKNAGKKVLCFASTLSIAERMIKFGADAIVLEGSEAGGHIGHVSATVLLQQVLFKVSDSIPVFMAGGIATGKMAAHMFMMGAAGVQLGTRFVMTDECLAHPNFKDSFRRAEARDAVSTPQYDSKLPVVAVRALRNKGMASFGALQLDLLKQLNAGEISRQYAQEEVEKYWIGALRRAVVDGDVDYGSLMAGQSVGLAGDVMSVKDLVAELVDDASAELEFMRNKLNSYQ